MLRKTEVAAKEQLEGHLCGDGTLLYLDCCGDFTKPTGDEMAERYVHIVPVPASWSRPCTRVMPDVTVGAGGRGVRKEPNASTWDLCMLFIFAASFGRFFVGCHIQQHLDPKGQRAWMLGSEGPEFKSQHTHSQVE